MSDQQPQTGEPGGTDAATTSRDESGIRAGIDIAEKERLLKLAEAHAALGKRHIEKQLLLIASMEREGEDTANERKVLNLLCDLQAEHDAYWERLRRGLEGSNSEGECQPVRG
jgi:hypothetical protein